jgi:hypothetical protein
MLAGGALAAGDDLGTLFDRVGDVGLDLLDRLHVDQRPDHRTRLEPVGDLNRAGGVGEALGKGTVDEIRLFWPSSTQADRETVGDEVTF